MGATELSEYRSHHAGKRVLIGLRDTLIADALSGLLTDAGFVVTGCLTELEALLEKAVRSVPDVVIVGPGALAADGSSDCLAGLRARAPSVHIVIMLRDVDEQCARALMRYSINGVIPLAARSSEATGILRQVIDGNIVYPSMMLAHLAAATEPGLLSERQREVLEQVALGRSNDEIAQRLFISRNTVKFHLREIYARLGVRNRVEASRVAQRSLGDPSARPQAGPLSA
jgi:DNA-binding NarL/FixJ family response regulator